MEEIPIGDLYIDSSNIRTDYEVHGDDENTVGELAQSICTHGLMTPLSVRPDGNGKYKIYAGSRRFKAIQKLEWERIPCIISQLDDNEAKIKSLVENFMRQSNSYFEKTKAFTELYNLHGKDIKILEKLTGVKQNTLKKYIKISNLPETVLNKLDTKNGEKRLTLEVAEKLSKYSSDKAEKLANAFVSRDLTSRDMNTFISHADEKEIDLSDDEKIDDIIAGIRLTKATDSGVEICSVSHLNINGTKVDIDDIYIPLLYKYYQNILLKISDRN